MSDLEQWLSSKSHNVWHDTIANVDRYECNLTVTDLKALCEEYAAAKVGEALEKAKQLKRVMAHIEGTKRVETPYVTIKDIDEIAVQYGVKREEAE